ncbi:MAG: LON peptidase substrate-binding domain-containing protein [Chitinophagaceae bacterium]
MTNFIPIFPLALVVYPGEALNLHIFEPRYKQLILECVEGKKNFGIPSVVNEKVGEWGTMVEITEVAKTYENGEMDIKTKGVKVFRILETIPSIPDKLYSGAIVSYPDQDFIGNNELMQKLIAGIRQLHEMLNVNKNFGKPEELLNSYDLAHHAALSLEEEYELLGLPMELQRQEYIRRHLARVLPMMKELEGLKEKIKLNGHFKNLSGFKLD